MLAGSRYWLIVLAVSCAPRGQEPPGAPPPRTALPCERVITYDIDETFTLAQRIEILDAMDAWRTATGEYLCFVPGDHPAMSILRADEPAEVDRLTSKTDTPWATVGYAEEGAGWLITERLDPDQVFGVTVHEIGHLLGLDHYEGPELSWMHASIDRDPPGLREVPPRDGASVCAIHGCLDRVGLVSAR